MRTWQTGIEQLESRDMAAFGLADAVLEWQPGAWVDAEHANPASALGDDRATFVSLGRGGELTLGFLDETVTDERGPDLLVVDHIGQPDRFAAYAAASWTDPFVRLGIFSGTTRIDLDGTGLSEVRAIRLVDIGQSGDSNTYGLDLQRVEALNYVPILHAGDANRDGHFDAADIGQVLLANKYATGESATWAEGDWNADGVFDQLDLVAAMQTGNYLSDGHS